MKKMLLAAVLAFAPTIAFAQADPAPPLQPPAVAQEALQDADPALWVVRDEDTIIYLFGTFHLLDGRPWFNDEVRSAFDASQELVLEVRIPDNPADTQPLILRYAVDEHGPPLSQRLTPEQNAALARALAGVGAQAEAFDSFKPWFVAISLSAIVAQRLGLRRQDAPEMVLSQAAHERGMAIDELEGIELQFRLFASLPEEQQLAQLAQALDNLDRAEALFAPMLAAWSVGNIDGLAEILRASFGDTPDLHRLLFASRNAGFAQWIEERLARPGTVFVAIGAGHLAGHDSVQSILEARGLRVTRLD